MSDGGRHGTSQWYLKTEDGSQYGPVSWHELESWAHEGRVTPNSQILEQGSDRWEWAGQRFPHLTGGYSQGPAHNPYAASSHGAYQSRGYRQPHRGGAVLTLGILRLVICAPLGIIAWIMGAEDLKSISAGRMDPSGQGTTQAGMICGIIGTVLFGIGLLFWLIALSAGGMW